MSTNLIKKSAVALAVSTALLSSATIAKDASLIKGEKFSAEAVVSQEYAKFKANKFDQAQKQNYFIVRLASTPIVKAQGTIDSSVKFGNRLNKQSQAVKTHADLLQQERQSFLSELASALPSAKIDRHYDTLMNAVVVKSNDDIYESLQSLSGVTKVFREEMFFPNMDASLDLIKAKNVWENLGGSAEAGKGVRVAVIDTGIIPTNPMFSGEGFPVAEGDLPTDDYCSTVDPTFCNNKVIVARYSMPTFPQPDSQVFSPLDSESGHGTHTAGTTAGNPAIISYKGNDVEVSGVAPGAHLMVYKGLFTGGGSNVMLIEALEYAIEDGADVINNSWGGGYGSDPRNSAYAEVFENAAAAGVVGVVSAGNGGSGAQTIGGPANLESVISVANTKHGRVFVQQAALGETSPVEMVLSSVTNLEEDVSAIAMSAVNVDQRNFEGCSPFAADAFKDGFAIISRGSCAFTDKINNAEAAGAKAVLVYNNKEGDPIVMSAPGTNLPAAMISQMDGEMILESMSVEDYDPTTALTLFAAANKEIRSDLVDSMTSSSSRGPNGDPSVLKPNIAAPGHNILSSYLNNEDGSAGYAELTGTSMSGPHVAGAAAVLKAMYPEWTAQEIKSALANTSITEGLTKTDTVTPADAFDVGAGRLDLVNATNAKVTFADLGLAEPTCVDSCSYVTSVTNMTDAEVTYMVKASSVNGTAVATVHTSEVTLTARGEEGSSATVGFDLDVSLSEFDEWQFARLEIMDSEGVRVGHLPVAGYVGMTSTPGLSVATSTAVSGESLVVNTSLVNATETGQIHIKTKVPSALKIEDDSFKVSVTGGTQILAGANTDLNLVEWTGTLDQSAFNSGAFGGFDFKLAGSGLEYTPDCTESCDDTDFKFNLANMGLTYKLAGVEYDYITITTNGMIVGGNGSASGTGANEDLPNAGGQNSIIAPFWTDFDLAGTAAGDAGAGSVNVAILTLSNGVDYWVVEWSDAALYEDTSDDRYTVQAWIALNGDEDIFFNYVDVPSIPNSLTIGAEDGAGQIGVSHYFNGEGTAPISGGLVQLAYQNGGVVALEVDAKLDTTVALNAGMKDMLTVAEDTVADAADVLANDTKDHVEVVKVSMTSADETNNAVQKLMFSAPTDGFNGSTLNITTEPTNGSVAVVEGKLVYTPTPDFFGEDSFAYSAKGGADDSVTLAPTLVTVTVTNVNDAPVVASETVSASVVAGNSVTVESGISDIDGDDLTYTWTQTSGTSVDLDGASSSLTFTASTAETLTFEVVANDGTVDSAKVTASVVVSPAPVVVVPEPKKKSSGSLAWLMLLATPFAFLRRRKSQK